MLKVLFLIHDLAHGGAEKVLVNLVNNIDKSKFDVTLMTLFDVGVNKNFLSEDVNYKTCFKHPIPGNSHYLKLLSPRSLYKWLIKDNYDIVVSYLEGPTARIVAGAPENVKVVSWIHSTVANKREFCASFRSYKEAKKCYRRANKSVFVSEGVKNAFLKYCPTNNNIILYNTNQTNEIIEKALEEITEGDFPNDSFNWCSVGKLAPVKGFDRMLRIQKRLLDNGHNAHFHILGIGEKHNELFEQARLLGIENTVTFWGYQTNPYKFVRNCDLYVCASHAEGFSTAATEALIVGTPVCTVEVSGMKELLGNNNEFGIVTDNDENSLFSAIEDLIIYQDKLTHYKNAAKLRGKDFSTKKTTKAVEEMLFSI